MSSPESLRVTCHTSLIIIIYIKQYKIISSKIFQAFISLEMNRTLGSSNLFDKSIFYILDINFYRQRYKYFILPIYSSTIPQIVLKNIHQVLLNKKNIEKWYLECTEWFSNADISLIIEYQCII